MINFLNMQYFILVAENRSITRVAEGEHISQQSLSKHIKKIEDELGVVLLDRRAGCTLTYAGERFYDYCVAMLKAKREMEKEMLHMKKGTHGNLRLGVTYTRGRVFLPEILPIFYKENPFVRISVLEDNPHTLEEHLLHGHIDLYIGSEIREHPDIQTIELYSDRLYLIVPKSIAKKVLDDTPNISAESMEIEKFAAYNFIMLTRGNPVRGAIDNYTRQKRISLSYSLETENSETMFALSCKGVGISVYNGLFLKMHSELISSPDCPVCIIPVKGDLHSAKMSIGYLKGRYLSEAANRFIELSLEHYKNFSENLILKQGE